MDERHNGNLMKRLAFELGARDLRIMELEATVAELRAKLAEAKHDADTAARAPETE